MSKTAALAVEAIYRGVVIDARHLWVRGEKRRPRRNDRSSYAIGSAAGVQGPVAAEYVDGTSFALAETSSDDDGPGFVINVTARMTGQIEDSGVVTPLATWIERHGTRFGLPAAARAQIVCGQTTFVIASTLPPDRLARPGFMGGWRWDQQRYTVATGLGLLLLVLLAALLPPDAKALSFERVSAQLRFVDFVLTPPEQKPIAPPRARDTGAPAAAPGKAAKGPSGALGDVRSKARDRRFTLPGPPDTIDPQLARRQIDEIKTTGILGLLRPDVGSPLATILGGETALGSDNEAVLGNLIASRTGDAYAIGGLGPIGSGPYGAWTESLVGIGGLDTIGTRDPRSNAGYGPGGAADLGRRRPRVPDYIAGEPVVRGALDKEIVRRIIRRHINEVKYCYELELARHNDLAGRVAVNFTIAPTGQVAAAVVSSTTMNNARVESCLVGAVRRWEFPKPAGGGLVIATYPFSFMAAGNAGSP